MAVWIVFFAAMTASGATDGMHRGDSLPFWQQACAENRPHACERLLRIEASYCDDNAGWACNELGRHYVEGRLVAADRRSRARATSRARARRGSRPGCVNLLDPRAPASANPRALDLRLLLREGGLNLLDMPEPELYARACRHGWSFACEKRVAPRDERRAPAIVAGRASRLACCSAAGRPSAPRASARVTPGAATARRTSSRSRPGRS